MTVFIIVATVSFSSSFINRPFYYNVGVGYLSRAHCVGVRRSMIVDVNVNRRPMT